MPFALDVRTIIFLIFLGDVVSTLLLWAYGRDRKNELPFRAFMAGKALQAVGWLLMGLRGAIPAELSIGLANFSFFLGFALAAFAMTSIGRERPERLLRFYLGLGLATGIGFLLIRFQDVNVRIAYSMFVDSLCFTLPVAAYLVLDRSKTRLDFVLSALYGFSSLALFFRGVLALRFPQATLMEWNSYQAFSLLPAYLLLLVGNGGFLLLMKQDSDRELLLAATHDGLTGLLNRKTFLERAEGMLALSARQGEAVSLFMIDIDHFKRVNDTFGHQEGDRVLLDFAATVGGALRRSDVFGRYGGEEFVVFLPGTGEEEARLAAERLRAAVEARELRSRSGKPLRYTVSVGICTSRPDAASDMEELLRLGDKALYRAKDQGRNRVARCAASGTEIPVPAS
ncbi:GGDEF domain-containing protein [Paucidesulfovibrio longus]|uniref:GGDEF domain-containing protein n=1 Tax=Paucidesulfovibrio longus TaxID=889 RepID=UPI0003B329A9|nr:GGDEF domain-containing protein [Paucidesulfovibrio longus]